MTRLNLILAEHEEDLSTVVSSWLGRHGAVDEACAPASSSALWRRAEADLGLAGLLMPEAMNGQGAGPRDAAVVAGLLGVHLAPLPFIHRAAVANTLLATSPACDPDVAEAAATARRLLAVAVPVTCFFADNQFEGFALDGTGLASGQAKGVAAALDATDLILPARSADGPVLALVQTSDPAVDLYRELTLDETRALATVTLTGARSTVLATGGTAVRLLREALLLGVALLTAEQAGLARSSLEAAVAYAKERRQFGRPIGSFQALKHRMAELWLSTTSAEAASLAAIDSLSQGHPDAERIVCTAATFTADVAVKVAEERLQLRGGIGMTWEDPTHLYVKRAKSDQVLFGTPGHFLDHLAPLAGIAR